MKMKKSNVFISIGLLFIIAALFIAIGNVQVSNKADETAQRIVFQVEAEIPEEPDMLIPNHYPEREMPTVQVEEYRYIGTLEIPSLELTLPVMEEWDETRLKISPCRYYGSVYQDNLVIAGHNYARHFRYIKKLPMESEIIFTDAEGNVYTYFVAWVETLQAEQIEEMTFQSEEPENDWDLTLFTCTTGGGSRYTVRCIKMER